MVTAGNPVEAQVVDFLVAHEAELRPRWCAQQEAEWRAATTGRPEAWEEAAAARVAVQRLYADPAAARTVARWLASGESHSSRGSGGCTS